VNVSAVFKWQCRGVSSFVCPLLRVSFQRNLSKLGFLPSFWSLWLRVSSWPVRGWVRRGFRWGSRLSPVEVVAERLTSPQQNRHGLALRLVPDLYNIRSLQQWDNYFKKKKVCLFSYMMQVSFAHDSTGIPTWSWDACWIMCKRYLHRHKKNCRCWSSLGCVDQVSVVLVESRLSLITATLTIFYKLNRTWPEGQVFSRLVWHISTVFSRTLDAVYTHFQSSICPPRFIP
jgi:hypothetical protein